MKKVLLFLLIPIFSYAQCWKEISGRYAIATDGTIWRLNDDNFNEVLNTVTLVDSSTDWATLNCHGPGRLALKNNGTMWSVSPNGLSWQIGNATWIAIASKDTFSAAIKTDGTLWTWGNNDVGQLGNGTYNSASSPQQVGTDNDWQSVTAGRKFGCAIKRNGTMWFWGQSIGAVSPNINRPTQIGSDSNWRSVSAGWIHAVAIKTDGSIWSWGSGDDVLGLGTIYQVDQPTRVGTDNDWASVDAWGTGGISSGGHGASFSVGSSFAVKTNGTLWCWGKVNARTYLFAGSSFSIPTMCYPSIGNVIATDAFEKYALQADGTLWRLGATDSWQETNMISCEALAVQQIQSSVRFSVFPNPAADLLHITSPNNDPIKNITIYDLTGKTIFQTGNTNEIDVSTMQAGIYLLQAETEQKIHQAKFIKE